MNYIFNSQKACNNCKPVLPVPPIGVLPPEIVPPIGTVPAPAVGIVMTGDGKLNVRSGPSMEASIIDQLENGTNVLVLGREGNWLLIYHNNKFGYVSADYVKFPTPEIPGPAPLPPEPSPLPPEPVIGIVRTFDEFGRLNLRERPTVFSPVITTIPNGTRIKILGEQGAFYKVDYNGTMGYVSIIYIRVEDNLDRMRMR